LLGFIEHRTTSSPFVLYQLQVSVVRYVLLVDSVDDVLKIAVM
jgi:hypothetical protein